MSKQNSTMDQYFKMIEQMEHEFKRSMKTSPEQKAELLKQVHFLKAIEVAFKNVKDPVAFAMGEEKIAISYGGRSLSLNMDQLARFTANLKTSEAYVNVMDVKPEVWLKESLAGSLRSDLKIDKNDPRAEVAMLRLEQKAVQLGGQHFSGSAYRKFLFQTNVKDFSGDYLEEMMNIRRMTANADIAEIANDKIETYMQFDASFDQAVRYLQDPTQENTAEQRRFIYSRMGSQVEDDNIIKQNKKLIVFENMVAGDEALKADPKSANFADRSVMFCADANARGMDKIFNDTRNYNSKNEMQAAYQQVVYLDEMKKLISGIKNPDAQQIFANQLVENSSGFISNDMRQEARDFVKQTCPDTKAARLAQRKDDHDKTFVGKMAIFLSEKFAMVDKAFDNTLVAEALFGSKHEPQQYQSSAHKYRQRF